MRNRKLNIVALAACMTLGCAAAAFGQQAVSPQQALQQGNLDCDKLFLIANGSGNQFEIQLSQQALQKSQDQEVKTIAQRMIDDHTKAAQQLQQVAQKAGVQVPAQADDMQQKKIEAIGQLSGQEYDQAFLAAMEADHAKDVTEFANTAQTAKSQDVKQFAAQLLPTLQEHQMMVIRAAQKAGLPNVHAEAMQAGMRMQGEHMGNVGEHMMHGGNMGGMSGGNSSGNNMSGNNSGGSSSGGSSSGGASSGTGMGTPGGSGGNGGSGQ